MNTRYPSIEMLKERARKRMPGFAYDYLTGGCFANINVERNTTDIRQVQLKPYYLRDYEGADQRVELFGKTYDAPFGVAPVGLQGLMWPRACEILAKSAREHNIPFVLSTVSTASIEQVAKITDGKFWFQLYHPRENDLRDKLLQRAADAGCETLVILGDTPTFAYRPKEIRNGLSIPPQMTWRNIVQMFFHPSWSFGQLAAGIPEFKTIKPYIPKGAQYDLKHLGAFMDNTFSGRLTGEKIKAIRDIWKGNLVIKGIVNPEDTEKAIRLGVDGIIVSNHGGRQLDAGESTIKPLTALSKDFGGQIKIMMDGGMHSGSDIAVSIASGADFCFLGRAPMYGVGALGSQGGDQVFSILKRQLQQVMEQLGCRSITHLPEHLLPVG
ncbi:MAG: alpha-hydroxy acid oxidase [Verrucomicrobiota bacterium]